MVPAESPPGGPAYLLTRHSPLGGRLHRDEAAAQPPAQALPAAASLGGAAAGGAIPSPLALLPCRARHAAAGRAPGRPRVLPPTAKEPMTDTGELLAALRDRVSCRRTILDNLPQGVFLKDRDLRLVAVNPAFCAAAGRAEDQLIGRDDFDLYPPDLAERYRAEERRVLAEGTTLEGAEERRLAGRPRTVQTVRTPVRGPDGEVEGVLGIFWDVTDQ